MTIQLKAGERNIAVVLFIVLYKVVVTFKSVHKILPFVSHIRILKNLMCQPRFKKMRKYLWLFNLVVMRMMYMYYSVSDMDILGERNSSAPIRS